LRKELGDDGRASSFKDDRQIKTHDTTHTPASIHLLPMSVGAFHAS
jgi:hypothetical protein